MPRLPTTTLSRLPRTYTVQPSIVARRYVSGQQNPGDNVEGASGKAKEQAQPRIHGAKHPEDKNASEDVQAHNKEMDRRAEGKDKEDKVGKGFWSGRLSIANVVNCDR